MRRTFKISVSLIILLVSALALAVTAGANAGSFSVNPVLPENQRPESRGYFDLIVVPGQRQELVVEVSNSSDAAATMTLSLITVTTNRNGIVDYTAPGISDETLKNRFTDIAKLDKESITVPPHESMNVTISLTVPQQGFDGIILGAVQALKEITDEERASAGMIVNRYSYVLAIRLRQTDSPIDTEFLLGDVRTELVNHRAAIVADIRNPQPRLVMGVEASAQIFQKGNDAPVFDVSAASVDFAPNSIFPFSMVDRAGYGLRPGRYVALIQLAHEGKTWEFEHEFDIEEEEAAIVNGGALNQQAPQAPGGGLGSVFSGGSIPAWMLLAAGGGAVLLVLLIIMQIKSRRSNKRAYTILNQRYPAQWDQPEHTVVKGFVPTHISDPGYNYQNQPQAPAYTIYEAPVQAAPPVAPRYVTPIQAAPPVAPMYVAPIQAAPPAAPRYEAPFQAAPPAAPRYEAPIQAAPPVAPMYEAPIQAAPPAAPIQAAPTAFSSADTLEQLMQMDKDELIQLMLQAKLKKLEDDKNLPQ